MKAAPARIAALLAGLFLAGVAAAQDGGAGPRARPVEPKGAPFPEPGERRPLEGDEIAAYAAVGRLNIAGRAVLHRDADRRDGWC